MTRQVMARAIDVRVRIRKGGPAQGGAPRWLETGMAVPGDFTVIELLETIKGERDPSLVYRHSCHHGSCGTCAMRMDGEERLACITGVAEVVAPGAVLTLEPLAHLPWLADLANDPTPFMERMDQLGPGHVRVIPGASQAPLPDEESTAAAEPFARFADCIECGACISACPIADPVAGYIGPAPLAAARDAILSGQEPGGGWGAIAALAGGPHGVWQCHHAFECSRACPAGVEPGQAIMALRLMLLTGKANSVTTKGGRS